MTVLASTLKFSKESALLLAQKKGGLFGQIFIRKDFHEVELVYFPYFKTTLDLSFKVRKFFFCSEKIINTKVSVVVSGTTGKGSIIDGFPELKSLNSGNHSLIEPEVPEKKVIEQAVKCAQKYVIRSVRTIPIVDKVEIELFYRPFWVAYYGEKRMGEKIYYLPIQADGYSVNRTT